MGVKVVWWRSTHTIVCLAVRELKQSYGWLTAISQKSLLWSEFLYHDEENSLPISSALHRGWLKFTPARPLDYLTMAAMLPGAVPAPAKFATIFGDTSKDPTNNNPQTLIDLFFHNMNDDTNNVSMENIREKYRQPGIAGQSRQLLSPRAKHNPTHFLTIGNMHPLALSRIWMKKSSSLMESLSKTKSHCRNS